MNPIIFGSIYIGSWLLMGLGLFLALRISRDLRHEVGQRIPVGIGLTSTGWVMRASLISLVVLISAGITYAGVYTFYNLMFAR